MALKLDDGPDLCAVSLVEIAYKALTDAKFGVSSALPLGVRIECAIEILEGRDVIVVGEDVALIEGSNFLYTKKEQE